MNDLFAWLGALLNRKHEDGTHKFSSRDAEDLVATIVLSTGFEAGSLPPRVARAIESLAIRAQLDPTETPEARDAALLAYFEANPLPEELLIDFRQNVRESLQTAHADDPRRALFAGATRARREGEARPKGTRPGGALGFFLAKKDV